MTPGFEKRYEERLAILDTLACDEAIAKDKAYS
jgi:hypothetical protein